MSVSPCLEKYLHNEHVSYDVISHAFTDNAYDTACSARVPISNVVKAVVLKDRKPTMQNRTQQSSFVVAAIPASNRLKMSWVNQELERDLVLADEIELAACFADCALGAIPGVGQAFDMDMIWDDQLGQQPNLYFEAGDHEQLIHMDKKQFEQLFHTYPHGVISLPSESYSVYHADEIRGGMN